MDKLLFLFFFIYVIMNTTNMTIIAYKKEEKKQLHYLIQLKDSSHQLDLPIKLMVQINIMVKNI